MAAVVVQAAVQSVTPAPGGAPTWILCSTTGFRAAITWWPRRKAATLRRSFAGIPNGSAPGRDALGHASAGPTVVQSVLLSALKVAPNAAGFVEDHTPNPVAAPLRTYGQDHEMSQVDRSAPCSTRVMTLAACAATVVPLFYLCCVLFRRGRPGRSPRSGRSCPRRSCFNRWPKRRSQSSPTMALGVRCAQAGSFGPKRWTVGALPSLGLCSGLACNSAVVFLGHRVDRRDDPRFGVVDTGPGAGRFQVLATGIGFLGFTGVVWAATRSSPFVTWWWVLKNNTNFYMLAHRTYWAWVPTNAIELAVVLGIPVTVWAVVALAWPRSVPRASLATGAVLIVLTLGGWNLSEVARLWLPFMPVALGRGRPSPVSVPGDPRPPQRRSRCWASRRWPCNPSSR